MAFEVFGVSRYIWMSFLEKAIICLDIRMHLVSFDDSDKGIYFVGQGEFLRRGFHPAKPVPRSGRPPGQREPRRSAVLRSKTSENEAFVRVPS